MNRSLVLTGVVSLASLAIFASSGCGDSTNEGTSGGPSTGSTTSSGSAGSSASTSGAGGASTGVTTGSTGSGGTAATSATSATTAAASTTAGTGGSGGSGAGGDGGSGGKGSAGSSGGGAGGSAGSGGKANADGGAVTDGGGGSTGAGDASATRFSFFVASLAAMRALSGSMNGFGGDLRFGEMDGLAGADKICRMTAERSMPGNGKTWRAFLSVPQGPGGMPVNAIDRVGNGPWYDRRGRVFAMTKVDLQQPRPRGADTAIINDFPNEDGVSNQFPAGPGTTMNDNHATLTGSGPMGTLFGANMAAQLAATCQNWTSAMPTAGRPHVGYAFPRGTTNNWISIFDEPGCGAGVTIVQMGGADPNNPTVGSSGGYGGIYCFALTP